MTIALAVERRRFTARLQDGQRARASGPSSRREDVAAALAPAGAAPAQPRSCGALAGAACARARARSAARPARGRPVERSASAAASAAVKRSGSSPLATTSDEVEPTSASQRVAQLERLVDRHLLGRGDGDDARCGRGSVSVVVDPPGLAGDRADARGVGERPRRAEQRQAVAGGGRVEDDEVVGLGARRAALVLRELPDLADGQQLAHARASPRRGSRERARLRPAARPARAPGAGRPGTPPSPAAGSIETWCRPSATACSTNGSASLPASARDVCAGDLGDDRRAARARAADVPERRGDGRLADAALAGDDDERLVEQRAATRRPSSAARP